VALGKSEDGGEIVYTRPVRTAAGQTRAAWSGSRISKRTQEFAAKLGICHAGRREGLVSRAKRANLFCFEGVETQRQWIAAIMETP